MWDILYIRMDRGDEIIEKILMVCKAEGIHSCIFNGIGGCGKAEIQTFIPETGTFEMDHHVDAGHMKSIMVSYTAEIELRPVVDGEISRKYDPETDTGFWNFA